MKHIKRLLIISFISLASLAGVVFVLIIASGIPTTGKKIEKYTEPRKALMVIDIQEDFTGTAAGPASPYKNDTKIINVVNEIIKRASDKNMPVIYIRQEFEGAITTALVKLLMNGVAIKGSHGADIDKRVKIISGNIFSKSKGDAFSNPELDTFMMKNRIDELYLTGLDAEYCVHATAKGALNRGYKVNIITDAVLIGVKKNWNSILNEYRKDGIALLTAGEFR